MNSIYLNRVQAVGEQLLGQMLVLEDILEELGVSKKCPLQSRYRF